MRGYGGCLGMGMKYCETDLAIHTNSVLLRNSFSNRLDCAVGKWFIVRVFFIEEFCHDLH